MSYLLLSRTRIVLVAVVANAVLAASSLGAADLCVRLDLEEPPSWVNEAVWLPEQDQLLISDRRKNQISYFAADGAVVETTPFGEGHPPFAVVPFGTDYLFVNGSAQVDWVDLRLGRERPRSLNLAETRSSGWYVEGIWSKQTAIAGQTFVAMGGLLKEGRSFFGAFSYRLPGLDDSFGSGEPQPIFEFIPPPEHQANAAPSLLPEALRFDSHRMPFYTQSMKYIATIGSRAYMLVLVDRPVLVSYDTETHDTAVLEGFPWVASSVLPEPTESQSSAEHYARLASLDFPAGLYANDGALYALRRTPRQTGGTLWRLTKLVPFGRRLRNEGTVVLPTASEHISVLPTSDGWFVIEEGPVSDRKSPDNPKHSVGYKDVRTFIVVRNEALETPSRSPLADERFDERRAYCVSR